MLSMRHSAHVSWVLAGMCAVAVSAGAAVVALRPVQAPQLAVLPLDSLNAGTAVDRSLCLAFALVPDAASECADLRVTHALPASMSKGSVQVPTLLYNSAVAHPYPVVRTDVRYTSGTRPDSIEAILKVNGVERRRGMWSGATMTTNVPRRLALGYDAIPSGTGDSTGIYPYTLDIAAYVGGAKGTTTTVSDTLALVNRSASRMGPGWWLSGLEQLFPHSDGSLLWVGGDGSARRFASAGSNQWVAAPLTFPDTIRLASGVYTRFAKHGVRIRFNSQGNHIATVRRIGDSTVFRYGVTGSTPQLDTVTTLSGQKYVFHHPSGTLDSVTAPSAAGTTRRTRFTRAGGTGTITSITDPDTKVVSFGYHGTYPRRMTSRTDRRSTTTTFSYDAGWKVSQSSVAMSTVPDLVDQFTVAETRGLVAGSGLSALADTALAYTRHDGPRSDVGDSTRFFLDLRFGAPRRMVDALGNATTLRRDSPTLPALVTRVQRANGHVQLARYTPRGNLAVLVDSGGIVAGQRDSTRYVWNAAFDVVERIVPPLGDSLTRSIDSNNGNILWQEDRRGSGSRVTFSYETAAGGSRGLLRAITYPNAAVDSFTYDAWGNLRRSRTPIGIVTRIERDNLGRDTLTITPITAGDSLFHRKAFDLVDQVTRETRVGKNTLNYSLSGSGLTRDTSALRNDTLITQYYYDNEGNRTAVISSTSAFVTNVSTDESTMYDRAHRPTSITTGLGTQTFTYDPAGNVTAHGYASGASVSQTYDALNRLTRRVLPAVDEIQRRCQGFPSGPLSDGGVGPACNMAFPYYPNNGTGYRLAADTSVFTYDAVGQMLTADNRYARIKRAYTLNGLLARDSLIFGTYTNPGTDAERRGQNYSYDRNARRSSMAWEAGTTTYTYSVGSAVDFGPLQRVTDPGGNSYTLLFDALGRVDSLRVATNGGTVGVREKRTYDADGRLTLRERVSTNGSVGQLQLDSLTYNQRNTVDRAALVSRAQPSERVRYAYDPLGGVVAQERVRLSDNAYQVQEYRNDAYGNVFYSRTRTSASGDEAPAVSDYASDGLISGRQTILPPQGQITQTMVSEQLTQQGTGGRVTLSGVLVTIPPVNGGGYASQTGSRYYYRADEKLGVVQRYDFRVGSSASLGSWEEYWYDALGRRILTRARRSGSPPTGNGNLCNDPVGNSCQSYWQRTVWDGDQLLYEWRTPDGSTSGMNSGYAGYVHVEGLDQPLGLLRSDGTRVLNYNWRGLGESSVFTNGAGGDLSITSGQPSVDWPTRTQGGVYYTPNVLASGPSGPFTWFGTLAENGAGSTGLLYKRNRYFDPVSGRFTQADPIGLGGGLNLYGFANGDPVNYSDPFGLCPQWLTGRPCSGAVDAGAGFIPGVSTGIDVATALSGQNPLTGEDVGLLGRGIALAGVLTPVSGGQIRASGKFLTAAERALAKESGNTFEVIVRKALGKDGSSSAHLLEKDAAGRSVSVTHRVVDQKGNIIHQHQRHVGKSGAERQFPKEWVQFPDIPR